MKIAGGDKKDITSSQYSLQVSTLVDRRMFFNSHEVVALHCLKAIYEHDYSVFYTAFVMPNPYTF